MESAEQQLEPENNRPSDATQEQPYSNKLNVPSSQKQERPHTNQNKAAELEELAKLISAATGCINTAVESSQQISARQPYRKFGDRTAGGVHTQK